MSAFAGHHRPRPPRRQPEMRCSSCRRPSRSGIPAALRADHRDRLHDFLYPNHRAIQIAIQHARAPPQFRFHQHDLIDTTIRVRVQALKRRRRRQQNDPRKVERRAFADAYLPRPRARCGCWRPLPCTWLRRPSSLHCGPGVAVVLLRAPVGTVSQYHLVALLALRNRQHIDVDAGGHALTLPVSAIQETR